MPLPSLRVISISPLSPTSGGEKCVNIYLPCAKDKPTNKNTVMCSGNMFPATDLFETKQSSWSTQILTASSKKPDTVLTEKFLF